MNSDAKVVLVILDGWGYRPEKDFNAIAQALTPTYSRLLGNYPNGLLNASHHYVGLPDGVFGNSEVGHMNIGCGRRIPQDQVQINEDIASGDFFKNEVLLTVFNRAKASGKNVHLFGSVSTGSVHSAEAHYLALVEFAAKVKFPPEKLFFHVVLDGRDTPPKSGAGFITTLENTLQKFGGRIATVSGRFYTMDRDQRWERVNLAYEAMVLGKGEVAASAREALDRSYVKDVFDEFVLPTVIQNGHVPLAKISSGDEVLCFNFRSDRMREIVRCLGNLEAPIPAKDPSLKVNITTFVEYDASFPFALVFGPRVIKKCLGEVIEHEGLKQFRTAETEKYAHVTFFFNGGMEKPFAHEERLLVPSPKVKTYDVVPEMSSVLVTDGVVNRIAQENHSLIVVNYAQPDMVGHSGNFEAAVMAVEATDRALKRVVEAAMDHHYSVIISADHGNIEMMKDPMTGEIHTSHTTNPVPIICVGEGLEKYRIRANGSLCDISPTLLQIMGIAQPVEMTGKSLLV